MSHFLNHTTFRNVNIILCCSQIQYLSNISQFNLECCPLVRSCRYKAEQWRHQLVHQTWLYSFVGDVCTRPADCIGMKQCLLATQCVLMESFFTLPGITVYHITFRHQLVNIGEGGGMQVFKSALNNYFSSKLKFGAKWNHPKLFCML